MRADHQPISLAKGKAVSLDKTASDLRAVVVGLGWDPRVTAGAEFDLDASALLLRGHNVLSDQHFVFYNNLRSPDGSVLHTGDNRTGEGEGDDEQLVVDLSRVPPECDRIVFPVSIHEAELRRQNFGQVRNAFIRVVDDRDDRELVRYDLTEDFAGATALIFGELFRDRSGWGFRALGQAHPSGFRGLLQAHGLLVA